MFFIPYDEYQTESPLSSQTIRTKLLYAVDTTAKWYQHSSNKAYRGQVTDDEFRIYRNIKGRNTYLPVIKGNFEQKAEGTKVVIVFSLHPIVLISLLLLTVGAEVLAIYIEKGINFAVLFAFVAFHCLMYIIGYLPEKRKAEAFFEEIFGSHLNMTTRV